jgi:hypothetical protein
MTFNGWVPLRRGIVDHLRSGQLTNSEALTLIILISLADKRTGAGTINAPTLRCFLPELSYAAAKRVLESLQLKRYVFREITPFSKVPYRFFVDKYEVTAGQHKGFRTDLSQVFDTKEIRYLKYTRHVPDSEPHPEPEGEPHPEPHPVLNNNKDKDNNTDNDNPLLQGMAEPFVKPTAAPKAKPVAEPKAQPKGQAMVIPWSSHGHAI